MKTIVLEGKSLCKTFTNGEVSTNVIRNLDVEVYEGDFTVIMGTSGAGKSTLLYLLSGIDDITSGEMYLNEKRIDNLKENKMIDIRRNQIGFVFQEPNLIDDFSVYENIVITGYLGIKNRKEDHRNTDELLENIDMIEHKNKYPSHLEIRLPV